jgi:uncharacterized protein (DUF2235 family)
MNILTTYFPWGDRLGRKIIVLSDGTGHGARKLFRTNVWRIYQALDLSGAAQIALYDDGVGTSKLKLLAFLGGGFGWGLKHNVLNLYTFLCQNYAEDDDIYAFGFSRGAFTVRVLMKFVLSEGLVTDFYSQDDLRRKARYLYRRFCGKRKTSFRIENIGRSVRDGALTAWDIMNRSLVSRTPKTRPVKRVKFIGVWDTVDAYGMPVREFKLGVNNYLWPLALEDRVLNPAVEKACHALSIDDRRHTFHPLLWDESDATHYPTADNTDNERLTQVWFAGVHSNVGGGYPDDSLSHVSLCWMIGEAQKKGLKFDAAAVAQIKSVSSPYGRIYNSRAGFGAYYRYDPRRLDPPTDSQGASIPFPKVHSSVFWRIAYGSDSYAPLNLPRHMRVVSTGEYDRFVVAQEQPTEQAARNTFSFEEYSGIFEGQAKEADPHLILSAPSDDALALIWDTVWWRRIVYFATLTVTLYVAALSFFPTLGFDLWFFIYLPFDLLGNHPFEGPPALFQIFDTPLRVITRVAEALLPGFLAPVIDAVNSRPGLYLPWLLVLFACLMLGSLIDRRIQDRALAAWSPKWRQMRYLWSRQTARPRVLTAIAATMLLSAYASIFFAVTETEKDGERCHFGIACLLRGTKGVFSNDLWAFPIYRMYFDVLLLVTTALISWIYFKIAIESAPSPAIENRGFLLWIAHSLRHKQSLVQSHRILLKGIIPFAFAVAIVATIACISNQVSTSFMEYAGLLCRPPPTQWYANHQSADSQGTIVIQQPLNDYCGLVDVNPGPAPNATYNVVIKYANEPTDRKRRTDFFSYDFLIDVSVSIREISESIAALPFRRRIDQPWHVMIAKDKAIGGQETVLTDQSTEITIGPEGLYLYTNEPVIGLPFLYDWFYRTRKGTAEITLTPKISLASPVKSPSSN